MLGEPLRWQPWDMDRLRPDEYEAGLRYREWWLAQQRGGA
jgi:hypothetical protein